MAVRLPPPIRDPFTGRVVVRSQLPGWSYNRSRSYRSRMGLGLGQLDRTALVERQAELAQVRAERARVEAELARLQGRPVAITIQPDGVPSEADVAVDETLVTRRRKIPTLWIVAAGVAGFFVLRGLGRRRR